MRTGFLSLLLPTPQQTELLRACFWSGEEARAAWRRWRRGMADPRRGLTGNGGGAKALIALVHDAVCRSDLDVEAASRAAFAAAAMAEERRTAAYDAACDRAFGSLGAARVPFLALKGAALASWVYPRPSLRHSHDVDLLVDGADRRRAAEVLAASGFEPVVSPRATADRLLDVSRLPLMVHERLLPAPLETPPWPEVRARAVTLQIAGLAVQTLSAADQIVHVCGLASCCPSHHPLCWVCDAWYLIGHEMGLDWTVTVRSAITTGLAPALATMLGFLARELNAAVPPEALEALEAAARTADRRAREVALAGVRAARAPGLRALLRAASGSRERWEVVRALLPPRP
jgi:hypothetical protein